MDLIGNALTLRDLVAYNEGSVVSKTLIDKITYWTGVKRQTVRALVERIVRTCRDQQLHVEAGREADSLVELTAYGTTLAMNYLTRGRFVHS